MLNKTIKVTCTGAATLPLNEIADFQGGLKTLPIENQRKLKKSLIEHGISFPIFVWIDPESGVHYALDGHQRAATLKALQAEGYEIPPVPVAFVEAASESEARKKLLLVSSAYGVFDKNGVKDFLGKIEDRAGIEQLIDLSGINVERIMALLNEQCPPDLVPFVPERPPTTTTGDLWILGEHRLLCGDSTDASAVNMLFNGSIPLLMVTDPPYGVNYDAGLWRVNVDGSENRKTGSFSNDDRADWTETFNQFSGDIAYVWHAGVHAGTVQHSLDIAGFDTRAQIIWRKQHFVLGRGNYHWQHEPAWYAVRKGSTAHWEGDRKQTTIWDIPNSNPFAGKQDDVNTVHSTQKPVECMERPIRNHGQNGDGVYDPFVGSGTTIIASERQCRRCFAMDISPVYCDIAIQRWCNYTGKDAIRETDGAKWSELQSALINQEV